VFEERAILIEVLSSLIHYNGFASMWALSNLHSDTDPGHISTCLSCGRCEKEILVRVTADFFAILSTHPFLMLLWDWSEKLG
jgi:Fe-S oxidoreductase